MVGVVHPQHGAGASLAEALDQWEDTTGSAAVRPLLLFPPSVRGLRADCGLHGLDLLEPHLDQL